MSDQVKNPNHYQGDGMECIDAIQAQLTHDEFLGYLRGNVAKYIWRWREKGGVESLRKANVYLSWLIDEAQADADNGQAIVDPRIDDMVDEHSRTTAAISPGDMQAYHNALAEGED